MYAQNCGFVTCWTNDATDLLFSTMKTANKNNNNNNNNICTRNYRGDKSLKKM